jgi:hypothetical protein
MSSKIMNWINLNEKSTVTWDPIREYYNDRGELGLYKSSDEKPLLLMVIYTLEDGILIENHPYSELKQQLTNLGIYAAFAGAKLVYPWDMGDDRINGKGLDNELC